MAKKKAKKTATKNTTTTKEKCIIKDCGDDQYIRGLCKNCYYHAWAGMKEGTLNEEELLKSNLILPSRRGRRPGSALSKLRPRQIAVDMTAKRAATKKVTAKKGKKKGKK